MKNLRFEELRFEELRGALVDLFWNRYEIELLAEEHEFEYDISVLKNTLKDVLEENDVQSVVLFVVGLRHHLLQSSNSENSERIVLFLLSFLKKFEREAKLLNSVFKD
jgi:hypothetical protein